MVTMMLKPYQEVGMEVHEENTQCFIIQEGKGTLYVADDVRPLYPGVTAIVPKGTKHNVVAGTEGLVFWTIYGPREK